MLKGMGAGLPGTEPLHLECEHFVQCIQTGKARLMDGRHGLRVVRRWRPHRYHLEMET
jgi:hypothetical protein